MKRKIQFTSAWCKMEVSARLGKLAVFVEKIELIITGTDTRV
jgi:hypothetical protein